MGINATDIFLYNDFRVFLKDAYSRRKAEEKKFSHRYINTKVGVKSAGWFADIVGNRIGLNPQHIRNLSALFGLKPSETEYFRLLVELDQTNSVSEKTDALKRILAFKGAKPDVVGTDRFEFYAAWYHSAIRELLLLGRFGENPIEIAGMLIPPILPKQATKCLLLLAKLGLITKTPSGHFKPKSLNLIKEPSPSVVEWTLIQKAFIELSLSALNSNEKESRNFSALTLSFSPKGMRQAGEEIASLRKRLLAISLEDHARNRVYQCNFQVFPLSRSTEVLNDKK